MSSLDRLVGEAGGGGGAVGAGGGGATTSCVGSVLSLVAHQPIRFAAFPAAVRHHHVAFAVAVAISAAAAAAAAVAVAAFGRVSEAFGAGDKGRRFVF